MRCFLVVGPRERIKVKRAAEPISQRYEKQSLVRTRRVPTPCCTAAASHPVRVFDSIDDHLNVAPRIIARKACLAQSVTSVCESEIEFVVTCPRNSRRVMRRQARDLQSWLYVSPSEYLTVIQKHFRGIRVFQGCLRKRQSGEPGNCAGAVAHRCNFRKSESTES